MSNDEKEFYAALRIARAHKEHLGYYDFLPGFKAVVEIEKAFIKKNVIGVGGSTHPEVLFLKFKGKDKVLWMNEKKLHAIGEILGKNLSSWVGKKIEILADPTVKVRGRVTGGLVIQEAK